MVKQTNKQTTSRLESFLEWPLSGSVGQDRLGNQGILEVRAQN